MENTTTQGPVADPVLQRPTPGLASDAGPIRREISPPVNLPKDAVEVLYNRANALRESGQLDEAIAAYSHAHDLEPGSSEILNNLGDAFRARGRIGEAIVACRSAIQLRPDFAEAHNNLGNALRDQGKFDEAIAAYTQAAKLRPDVHSIHNNLGIVLSIQGRLDEAMTSYVTAIRLKPDYAKAHNNLGSVLRDKGRPEEAVRCCQRAIELKPDFGQAYNNLGCALSSMRRFGDAIAAFTRALELQPQLVGVHSHLADAYRQTGRLANAITAYRRAIQLKPNDSILHCSLGHALKDSGRLDEAIGSYIDSIQLKPDEVEPYFNLGNALRDKGQYEQAADVYREALKLRPDLATVQNHLGVVLNLSGKVDEAIDAFAAAVRLKPDYAKAYNNLGAALRDQGRFDDAVVACHTATVLKPDYAMGHYNLGKALRDVGRLDDAVAAYRAAIRLQPNLAEAYNNLGNAYKERGELDEAVAAYARAVELRPDLAQAQLNLDLARQQKAQSVPRSAVEVTRSDPQPAPAEHLPNDETHPFAEIAPVEDVAMVPRDGAAGPIARVDSWETHRDDHASTLSILFEPTEARLVDGPASAEAPTSERAEDPRNALMANVSDVFMPTSQDEHGGLDEIDLLIFADESDERPLPPVISQSGASSVQTEPGQTPHDLVAASVAHGPPSDESIDPAASADAESVFMEDPAVAQPVPSLEPASAMEGGSDSPDIIDLTTEADPSAVEEEAATQSVPNIEPAAIHETPDLVTAGVSANGPTELVDDASEGDVLLMFDALPVESSTESELTIDEADAPPDVLAGPERITNLGRDVSEPSDSAASEDGSSSSASPPEPTDAKRPRTSARKSKSGRGPVSLQKATRRRNGRPSVNGYFGATVLEIADGGERQVHAGSVMTLTAPIGLIAVDEPVSVTVSPDPTPLPQIDASVFNSVNSNGLSGAARESVEASDNVPTCDIASTSVEPVVAPDAAGEAHAVADPEPVPSCEPLALTSVTAPMSVLPVDASSCDALNSTETTAATLDPHPVPATVSREFPPIELEISSAELTLPAVSCDSTAAINELATAPLDSEPLPRLQVDKIIAALAHSLVGSATCRAEVARPDEACVATADPPIITTNDVVDDTNEVPAEHLETGSTSAAPFSVVIPDVVHWVENSAVSSTNAPNHEAVSNDVAGGDSGTAFNEAPAEQSGADPASTLPVDIIIADDVAHSGAVTATSPVDDPAPEVTLEDLPAVEALNAVSEPAAEQSGADPASTLPVDIIIADDVHSLVVSDASHNDLPKPDDAFEEVMAEEVASAVNEPAVLTDQPVAEHFEPDAEPVSALAADNAVAADGHSVVASAASWVDVHEPVEAFGDAPAGDLADTAGEPAASVDEADTVHAETVPTPAFPVEAVDVESAHSEESFVVSLIPVPVTGAAPEDVPAGVHTVALSELTAASDVILTGEEAASVPGNEGPATEAPPAVVDPVPEPAAEVSEVVPVAAGPDSESATSITPLVDRVSSLWADPLSIDRHHVNTSVSDIGLEPVAEPVPQAAIQDIATTRGDADIAAEIVPQSATEPDSEPVAGVVEVSRIDAEAVDAEPAMTEDPMIGARPVSEKAPMEELAQTGSSPVVESKMVDAPQTSHEPLPVAVDDVQLPQAPASAVADETYELITADPVTTPDPVRAPVETSLPQAMMQCDLAARFHAAGKLERTISCYRRAVELKPDFDPARRGLAMALQEKQQLIDAVAACELAASIRSDDANAYWQLAESQQKNEQFAEAVESYQTAVRLRPDLADAFCKLGNALRDQGKRDEAKEAYRKALSLRTDFREAQNNLLDLAFRR